MEFPEGLAQAGTAQVVDIIDGDTVVFADGSEGRLVGIQAPKLALGRPDFVDWPLAADRLTVPSASATAICVFFIDSSPENRDARIRGSGTAFPDGRGDERFV